jgi:hypothetical protein
VGNASHTQYSTLKFLFEDYSFQFHHFSHSTNYNICEIDPICFFGKQVSEANVKKESEITSLCTLVERGGGVAQSTFIQGRAATACMP